MVTHESLLRDIARIFVWFPLRWFVQMAPLSVSLFVFALMGKAHYYVSRGKKRLLREKLSRIFHGQNFNDYEGAARRFFENWYTHTLLPIVFTRLKLKNISRFITFDGMDKIEKALSQGRGCLLVHGHFGPSQFPLVALALQGHSVSQINYLRPMKDSSYIGKIIVKIKEKCESRAPVKFIPATSFMRPVFQALKRNEIVFTAGDGTGEGAFIGKYVPIKFSGGHLNFPTGPVSIAKKTGAVLLPLFTVKVGRCRYKAIIEDPLELQGGKDGSLIGDVEKFAEIFETYVKRYPCHWYIMDSTQWLNPEDDPYAKQQ
jgi:phosphatidylinositol dimannoside acyltransferase